MSLHTPYKITLSVIVLMLSLVISSLSTAETRQTSQSPLYEALTTCDVSRVNELIQEGVDVNAKDKCGRTALMEASRRGCDEIVHALLEAGSDANAQTHTNIPMEPTIEQHGELCPHGHTALSEAAQRGHRKTVRLLLDGGADVGGASKALGNAAEGGHEDVVRMLLDAGHDVDVKEVLGSTPLSRAVIMGHMDIVRILLDAGAKVGEQSEALSRAALHGSQAIVQMLLEAGHDIEAQYSLLGITPLQSAAWGGHNEVVRQLLKAGADVNAQGQLGDAKGAYTKAPPDAPAQTALMLAVSAGHEETVQILLNEGADIEAKSYYGTALSLAASKERLRILKMLIDAGADVNAQDLHGRTALTMTRDPSVIALLRDAGADIKKLNSGLLWDLGAMVPAIVSTLLGMLALHHNKVSRNKGKTGTEKILVIARERYILSLSLFISMGFLVSYAGLVYFWSSGTFEYSEYFGYSAVGFLLLSLSMIPIVLIVLMLIQRPCSWTLIWFVVGSAICVLATSVLWYVNHAVELMFL